MEITNNNTNNQIQNNQEEVNAYFPSKNQLAMMAGMMMNSRRGPAIVPGHIARTDGFDVDEVISGLEHHINKMKENNQIEEGERYENLLSRLMSVSDLTPALYERFKDNPNNFTNWFGELNNALKASKSKLKTPKSKAVRLPIELAQFIRLEYPEVEDKDKQLFNEYIFKAFELEDDKTYFIKTGTFSSKFQFANAKCKEPREMGEYFQVINNFAMTVGAGQSIELVVREYIEDVENNPTIYNGMPLRTEFRAFVDFDTNQVIGIVPYWNPIVMKRALSSGLCESIEKDYQTYLSHEITLVDEYNEHLSGVRREIKNLIPHIELEGQYSIDIMKNGEDFYVIDMALMKDSALTELI